MTKPSILFISSAAYWPLTDGKRQRTYFILQALVKQYEVDVLFIGDKTDVERMYLSDLPISRFTHISLFDYKLLGLSQPDFRMNSALKNKKKTFRFSLNKNIRAGLLERNYKFIFFRYLDTYFSTNLPNGVKLIADPDDIFNEKQWSLIRNESDKIKKLKRLFLLLLNSPKYYRAYYRINQLFVTKTDDQKHWGLTKAKLLPNLPFSVVKRIPELQVANTKAIGFMGKLTYLPNIQGLKWFLTFVWPVLIMHDNELQFVIAGTGSLPESLAKLIEGGKNIIFLGSVDDVAEFWKRVSFSVVPIFSGGGTNIKIAESFCFGKPVVVSSFAARGYSDALAENVLLSAKSENDWIESCLLLTKNEPVLKEYALKSYEFARQHYQFLNWETQFLTDLESV